MARPSTPKVSLDLACVQGLLGLGHWVREADGLTYERGFCQVAASLVRAIQIAAYHGATGTGENRDFDDGDLERALGAVAALLREGPDLVGELRHECQRLGVPVAPDEPLDPSDPQKMNLPKGPEEES